MDHIGSKLRRSMVNARETERGELMRFFCAELNRARLRDGLAPIAMGRMGKMLQLIPTKDLYYLKTVCSDATNFSKKFWWEIKPKNHTELAKKLAAEKFKKNLK